ncbi:MAG TPA: outer membrane beta-barrel protein [Gemmatimonadaceae bacterium]|nr:outer membrane beta-barrel protein [Gemmatimonadaceae bacterium]
MRTPSYFFATIRAGALVTALSMSAAASVHAQSRATPLATGKAFDFTPYAGYMIFGDYIKGPLGTSLSNAPAPVYGAQLGMRLAPNLSLVGNLATTSSDIKAGIPIIGGFSVAHSNLLLYDAGLQLDIPVTTMGGTSLSPFVQAGAGAIRYDISESVISTKATNFAANVGLGADIALGNGVGVRVMAKDYIGKFDFKDATYLDFSGQTAHSVALSAGLRLSF